MTFSALILSFILSLFYRGGDKLDNYLSEQLSDFQRFEYQIISQPPGVSAGIRFEIDYSREFKINRDFGYIPVTIFGRSGKVTRSVISVKLRLFSNVFVAKKEIPRGAPLSFDDFIITQRDVTSVRGKVFYDVNSIEKYRSKVNLRAKSVLVTQTIERIPDVRVGDKMTAYTKVGDVIITIVVHARTEGCTGDIIRVIDEDRRVYTGKVETGNVIRIIG